MKKEKVVHDAKYCQEVRKNNERNLSFNYGNLEFMCEELFCWSTRYQNQIGMGCGRTNVGSMNSSSFGKLENGEAKSVLYYRYLLIVSALFCFNIRALF